MFFSPRDSEIGKCVCAHTLPRCGRGFSTNWEFNVHALIDLDIKLSDVKTVDYVAKS